MANSHNAGDTDELEELESKAVGYPARLTRGRFHPVAGLRRASYQQIIWFFFFYERLSIGA